MSSDSSLTIKKTKPDFWKENSKSLWWSGITVLIGIIAIVLESLEIIDIAYQVVFLLLTTLIAFFIPKLIKLLSLTQKIQLNFEDNKNDGVLYITKQNQENISEIIAKINNHEATLNKKVNYLRDILGSLGSKLDIGVIEKLPSTPKEKFMIFLKNWTKENKENFDAVFNGEFKFSSDVFEDLYIKLLEEEVVEHYYSTGIIYDSSYFIKNNIEKLKDKYIDIARDKPVTILTFIDDTDKTMDTDKDKDVKFKILYDRIQKELQNGISDYNSNRFEREYEVIHKIGRLSWIDKPGKDLIYDFGIAYPIASALMSRESGIEKYSLYFNADKFDKFMNIFKDQERIIDDKLKWSKLL